MGVKVTGAKELLAKLKLFKDRAKAAASAALYQRALQIIALSDSMVPVDTGRLRASHFVGLPDDSGKLKMGYGANYAMPVHERLDVKHEHGQAKFLETAFDNFASSNAAWLREKTVENIRKGIAIKSGGFPTTPESGDLTGAHHEALRMNRAHDRARRKK
jgi:hypothetical protein